MKAIPNLFQKFAPILSSQGVRANGAVVYSINLGADNQAPISRTDIEKTNKALEDLENFRRQMDLLDENPIDRRAATTNPFIDDNEMPISPSGDIVLDLISAAQALIKGISEFVQSCNDGFACCQRSLSQLWLSHPQQSIVALPILSGMESLVKPKDVLLAQRLNDSASGFPLEIIMEVPLYMPPFFGGASSGRSLVSPEQTDQNLITRLKPRNYGVGASLILGIVLKDGKFQMQAHKLDLWLDLYQPSLPNMRQVQEHKIPKIAFPNSSTTSQTHFDSLPSSSIPQESHLETSVLRGSTGSIFKTHSLPHLSSPDVFDDLLASPLCSSIRFMRIDSIDQHGHAQEQVGLYNCQAPFKKRLSTEVITLPFDETTPMPIHSCTKTVTSFMFYWFMEKYNQGKDSKDKISLKTPISHFLGTFGLNSNCSLTIEDVINMKMGLPHWDEQSTPYSAKDNPMNIIYERMATLGDPIAACVEYLNKNHDPNVRDHFAYNTMASCLLLFCIQMMAYEIAHPGKHGLLPVHEIATPFFDAIGISPQEYSWEPRVKDFQLGGSGICLTPNAMAKLGAFIAQDGAALGIESWVQAAKHEHFDTLNPNKLKNGLPNVQFGRHLWHHLTKISTLDGNHELVSDIVALHGFGGQRIYLIPNPHPHSETPYFVVTVNASLDRSARFQVEFDEQHEQYFLSKLLATIGLKVEYQK
jgi:hypothetical protein